MPLTRRQRQHRLLAGRSTERGQLSQGLPLLLEGNDLFYGAPGQAITIVHPLPPRGRQRMFEYPVRESPGSPLILYLTTTKDVVVEVSLGNLASSVDYRSGVVFRYIDPLNYLTVYATDSGIGILGVVFGEVMAGVETLYAGGFLPAATDTVELRVIAQGNRIRCWVNFAMLFDQTTPLSTYGSRAGLLSGTVVGLFGPPDVTFENFYAQGL